MNSANYCGTWVLIPELCIYQKGPSPLSAKYTIASKEGALHFRLDWTDEEGMDHKLEFGGVLDGVPSDLAVPGITGVTYQKIDDNTLDSTAYINADVVMYCRRVVSQRKDLLLVLQVGHTDDGSFRNVQVYRREGS